MLEADVDKEYGAHVASQLKRAATQNQFAALVSLYFAIGTASFSQSSVLRLANAPGATAIINRPTAPVATGGSTATDARKAGQRQGTAAVGADAVATSTPACHGRCTWLSQSAARLAENYWRNMCCRSSGCRGACVSAGQRCSLAQWKY